MKNKYIILSVIISTGLWFSSCSDFLDIEGKLGENTQSLEKIFEDKDYTEEWLAEAFTYLTAHNIDIHNKDNCITNFADDMCYGDRNLEYRTFKYAEYSEGWKQDGWKEAYDGIRQASILIHNVDKNKEMTTKEIADIKAQGRFIRAYLYWKLLQKYGPIPLIPDEGLDYNATYDDLAIPRSTYDECADFIANEMLLAAKDLEVDRDTRSIARPTRGAALATRAKVLLYAASPINNPRPSDTERFTDLIDHQGKMLIAQEYSNVKWAKAAAAAKDVIRLKKYQLHTSPYRDKGTLEKPKTIIPPFHSKYSNAPFPKGWVDIDPFQSYASLFDGSSKLATNKEVIFTLGQNSSLSNLVQHQLPLEAGGYNCHAMTGKQCDAYETNEGKPFNKNQNWTGEENYISEEEEKSEKWLPLRKGVNKMYAHREPRFYASVAFNGAFWPMTNTLEPNEYSYQQIWYYRGEESGWANTDQWLPTGIGIMKYVNTRDNILKNQGRGIVDKPVIGIRYADVLLWYAEALNEITGSHSIPSWDNTETYTITRDTKEMSDAISQIRIRAGLPDYDPEIYESQNEFRIKLKHERQIEMFAENSRYFDLRRWKDAEKEESQQIYGCNPLMSEKERDWYHKPIIISDLPTTFNRKMYFWPISHDELRKNKNLTQNPGWTYYD